MAPGCPVCNGLTLLSENCPLCGTQMEDCGSLADQSDPYGPYEEEFPNTPEGTACTGDDQCIHFLQCPNCDESTNHAVSRNEF